MKLAEGAVRGGGAGERRKDFLRFLAASSPPGPSPLLLCQAGAPSPKPPPQLGGDLPEHWHAWAKGCGVRAVGLRSAGSFSCLHLHETPASKGISKQWGG